MSDNKSVPKTPTLDTMVSRGASIRTDSQWAPSEGLASALAELERTDELPPPNPVVIVPEKGGQVVVSETEAAEAYVGPTQVKTGLSPRMPTGPIKIRSDVNPPRAANEHRRASQMWIPVAGVAVGGLVALGWVLTHRTEHVTNGAAASMTVSAETRSATGPRVACVTACPSAEASATPSADDTANTDVEVATPTSHGREPASSATAAPRSARALGSMRVANEKAAPKRADDPYVDAAAPVVTSATSAKPAGKATAPRKTMATATPSATSSSSSSAATTKTLRPPVYE